MGRLRIIAGALRGRRFAVPDLAGLRPTSDRVREALFSIVGERVVAAATLDAWAGSGALGLEALSRGAATVTFVERDRRAAAALRAAAETLGVADRSRVVQAAVLGALRAGGVGGPFDLVLADPPWDSDERAEFLDVLARSSLVRPGGMVAVERAARSPGPEGPAGWKAPETRRWGDTAFDFWRLS